MGSLYVLVEGSKTEPILLRAWLPLLIPGFAHLRRPEDAAEQLGFYLISGNGYPSILNRIDNALEDIQQFPGFARLLICLDSEDRSVHEVAQEVAEEVRGCLPSPTTQVPVDVVVADCAVESWLLGNDKFVKRNASGGQLLHFIKLYDVTKSDPELMPNLLPAQFNSRAQFHKAYLKAAFRERDLKYQESRPGPACEESWLGSLIRRAEASYQPSHLQTFYQLITVARQHRGSAT